jgi:hypothetical protein
MLPGLNRVVVLASSTLEYNRFSEQELPRLFPAGAPNLSFRQYSTPRDRLAPGFWHHRNPKEYCVTQDHTELLARAYLDNETTLILDADVVFVDGAAAEFQGAIAELPDNWNILYLAACYTGQPSDVSSAFVRCTRMFGQWAYVASPIGAWRLHEHLRFWPRLSIAEAMSELSANKETWGSYYAMRLKIALPSAEDA